LLEYIDRVVPEEADLGGVTKTQLLGELAPEEGHGLGQPLLNLSLNKAVIVLIKLPQVA
jgi:hypothetical protein